MYVYAYQSRNEDIKGSRIDQTGPFLLLGSVPVRRVSSPFLPASDPHRLTITREYIYTPTVLYPQRSLNQTPVNAIKDYYIRARVCVFKTLSFNGIGYEKVLRKNPKCLGFSRRLYCLTLGKSYIVHCNVSIHSFISICSLSFTPLYI